MVIVNKKREMVDEEENEMTQDNEEQLDDEDDDDLIPQKKEVKQLPQLKKLSRPQQEVETQFEKAVEQPKVQLVEREINLSLINEKLNYLISLLSKE